MAGASGTVAGVMFAVAVENGPGPMALTARTRKLYAVPLVSPVIVVVVFVPVRDTVLTTVVPVRTWTSKPVIGEPPSLPASHDRFTAALAREPVRLVGAAGVP